MSVLSDSVRTTVDLETRISQFLASFDPHPPSREPSLPQTPRASSGSVGAGALASDELEPLAQPRRQDADHDDARAQDQAGQLLEDF